MGRSCHTNSDATTQISLFLGSLVIMAINRKGASKKIFDTPQVEETAGASTTKKGAAKKATSKRRVESEDSLIDDYDEEEWKPAKKGASPKKGATKKSAGKKTTKKHAVESEETSDDEYDEEEPKFARR